MIGRPSFAPVSSWSSASVSSTIELFVSPMSGVARPGDRGGVHEVLGNFRQAACQKTEIRELRLLATSLGADCQGEIRNSQPCLLPWDGGFAYFVGLTVARIVD